MRIVVPHRAIPIEIETDRAGHFRSSGVHWLPKRSTAGPWDHGDRMGDPPAGEAEEREEQ
jgi:hypothetical protein